MEKDPTLQSGELVDEKHEKNKKKKKSRVAKYISSKLSKFLSSDSEQDKSVSKEDETSSFKDKLLEFLGVESPSKSIEAEDQPAEESKTTKIIRYLKRLTTPSSEVEEDSSETHKARNTEDQSEENIPPPNHEDAPTVIGAHSASESTSQHAMQTSETGFTGQTLNVETHTRSRESDEKSKALKHKEHEKFKEKTNRELHELSVEVDNLTQENEQLQKENKQLEGDQTHRQSEQTFTESKQQEEVQPTSAEKVSERPLNQPVVSHEAPGAGSMRVREPLTISQEPKEAPARVEATRVIEKDQPTSQLDQEINAKPVLNHEAIAVSPVENPESKKATNTVEQLVPKTSKTKKKEQASVGGIDSGGANTKSAQTITHTLKQASNKVKIKPTKTTTRTVLIGTLTLLGAVAIALAVLAYAYFS